MNKKGFTLIELLAVIVILAVIALITAPIVVGIINDSKESSNKISVTNYIRAVNTAITKATADNKIIKNGLYQIDKEGNICLDEIENTKCVGEKINITANGNRPIVGNILIEEEVVARATISYDDFSVEVGYDGKMEYKPFSLKYNVGQKVKVITGGESEGVNVDWYVIDEDKDTVTLLFSDVLLLSAWNNTTYHNLAITTGEKCVTGSCAYAGPIEAYSRLNNMFENIDIPYINYEHKNNPSTQSRVSYQGLNIKNGEATIITHNGTSISSPFKVKARLISAEEVLRIASLYNSNITEQKLFEYLSNNIDTINYIFNTNNSTIDDFFEQGIVNNDLVSLYTAANTVLVSQLYNGENPSEIKYEQLPSWLTIQDKSYWTNTTYDFKMANQLVSYPIQILSGIIGSEDLGVMYISKYYTSDSDTYIRPVIQMKKDDNRIHS